MKNIHGVLTVLNAGNIDFTFDQVRFTGDATYTVQSSLNLADWTDEFTASMGTVGTSVTFSLPIPPKVVSPLALLPADIGKQYIVNHNATLDWGGAGINAPVGTVFTYDGNAFGDVDPGLALPFGTLSIGANYTVLVAGDYSSVGGPAAAAVGNIFTATATGPFPGGLQLRETFITGDSLTVGSSYTVTITGAGADYSAIGGPASTIAGDIFVATATTPLSAGELQYTLITLTDISGGKIFMRLKVTLP